LVPRYVALQNPRQYFLRNLDQSFCPARLLRLECRHFHRQLSRAFDVLQINELPTNELRAIRKVGIFGERVMLPSTCLIDSAAPPHAGRAIEIKKNATARPPRV